MNSALGLLFREWGREAHGPSAMLGPHGSLSSPGLPLPLGHEAAPARSKKGQREGHKTQRNVWQTKCRCSTGREANRGPLFGSDLLIHKRVQSEGLG